MKKLILICNAGSATLKFKLFDYSLNQIASGNFEKIGLPGSFLKINKRYKRFGRVKTHSQALKHILNELRDNKQAIRLIGHRVVHGGEQFIKPTLVTKKVWHQIAKYNELAPLHNPSSLKVIQASFKILPKAQNIAVFDTAFYASLTPEQFLYALPYEFYRRHKIRRYGFHGISHKYVAGQAAKKLNKPLTKINLITVHLGNGCSITAVKKGKPIATSMGFTPLEGLVMGTRSGNIDPALPLFIQRKFKLGYDKVEKILNKESGLLGISGFTSDMREILKAAGYPVIDYHGRTKFTKQQKVRARLALKIFITRLQNYISLYASLLGSIQAIVFTGGIGERSSVIRQLAVQNLKIGKKTRVIKINADEELEIARQIRR